MPLPRNLHQDRFICTICWTRGRETPCRLLRRVVKQQAESSIATPKRLTPMCSFVEEENHRNDLLTLMVANVSDLPAPVMSAYPSSDIVDWKPKKTSSRGEVKVRKDVDR